MSNVPKSARRHGLVSNVIKWVALLLLMIVLLVLLLNWGDASMQQGPSAHADGADAQEVPTVLQKSSSGGISVDLTARDFEQCQRFIDDTANAERRWGRDNYESWARFLQQGYSLDDVTLAVEHFVGAGFAVTFRAKQLRADTKTTVALAEQNEQFRREHPEAVDLGIRVVAQLPSPMLAEFATMDRQAQEASLQGQWIGVDELAYFLRQEAVSDKSALLLMDHTEDLFAVISVGERHMVSVLDVAVKTSRASVVEALLRAGLMPTDDTFFGSSMEWALHRLSRAGAETENEHDAAHIVSLLQSLSAPARFRDNSIRGIYGQFRSHFYQFDANEIARINRSYGLDLTQIDSLEPLAVDYEHPLMVQLEAARQAHLNTRFGTEAVALEIADCEAHISTIQQQWQPRPMRGTIQRVMAQHPDAPDRIKYELAQIDPKLVDIYQEEYQQPPRGGSVQMPDKVVKLLRQGDIDAVVAYYQNQVDELTDAHMNWLMWQIIEWDPTHYKALAASGLLRTSLQYYDMFVFASPLQYRFIEQLESSGADMRGYDSRDKTVLYYAVQGGRVELVSALAEHGYPFSYDRLGRDPLHVALDWDNSNIDIQTVERLLPSLMAFNPRVDDHHLSRMALIQLKYPHQYKRITREYPELTVTQNTKLPLVD